MKLYELFIQIWKKRIPMRTVWMMTNRWSRGIFLHPLFFFISADVCVRVCRVSFFSSFFYIMCMEIDRQREREFHFLCLVLVCAIYHFRDGDEDVVRVFVLCPIFFLSFFSSVWFYSLSSVSLERFCSEWRKGKSKYKEYSLAIRSASLVSFFSSFFLLLLSLLFLFLWLLLFSSFSCALNLSMRQLSFPPMSSVKEEKENQPERSLEICTHC